MQDMEQSYHYGVMRRAIEMIDEGEDALSLEDLAAAQGMSPTHFQRQFSKWAGISPKRFQQYLTLGHAKSLLHERFTTLDTAHSLGLSGTGRLHDLFLRWEAMSPGDYAKKGAGLTIHYGWFDGPFGDTLVMGTPKGICGLGFASETSRAETFADLSTRWPKAHYVEAPAELEPWVQGLFGDGHQETPLLLIGSPLQIKVWEALMRIPTGRVTTYSEIAHAIGAPKAVRAVGTAIGKNPISWIIPCHRALRKSGGLGGYHWGLPVKRAMLAYEAAQHEALQRAS